MSDDLAHDAHLRAALRHAPDHALTPPAGLTQTILAAARQAPRGAPAGSAAPPPMRMRVAGSPPLRAWLRRMMSPRWAGAWAAGLLAALGLGLWLDLELQPDVEHTRVLADASSAATRAGDATESTRSAVGAPGDTAQVAQLPAQPAPVAPAAAPSARRDAEAPREEGGLAKSRRAAAPATATAPAAEKGTTATRAQGASARGAPDAVAAPPVRSETADVAATANPPMATASPADVPPATAAEQPPRHVGGVRAPLEQFARSAKAARTSPAPPTAPLASPVLTLLRRAQGEQAAGTASWTWAAPGRPTIVPFDARAQAWLSRVVHATQDRWSEVDDNGESLDAIEARWWRDGWPLATLRVESGGLRWFEPGRRIRYAPLDAATLQRLRSD